MYHDNYERSEIEAFAESLRNGAHITRVIVNDTNTVFLNTCLSEMHDTATCLYGNDIDNLAKLWNKEIGKCIAYTTIWLRFNKLVEANKDDNYVVFHRMLRFIVGKIKACYENDTISYDYQDNYYNGYKDAMLHIIDAFVYAYDIEFA